MSLFVFQCLDFLASKLRVLLVPCVDAVIVCIATMDMQTLLCPS